MMKNRVFLICAALSLWNIAFAQDVVLWDKMTVNSGKPVKGINSPAYNHFFAGWSLSVSLLENEAKVRLPASNDYSFGLRQIYKLNNHLATGYKLSYVRSIFSVDQIPGKNIHDSVLHSKEHFLISRGDCSLFFRVNFDRRRGAYMGHFLDLGVWGGKNFIRQRMIEDKTENESKVRIWYKRVEYIEKYSYGVYAGLGLNRYLIFARFRMSDLFDGSYNFSQLPAFTFGIEIGLHR